MEKYKDVLIDFTVGTRRQTTCFIFDGFGLPEGVGFAFCRTGDKYNAMEGEKLSLKRALETTKFSKQKRAEIWRMYFEWTKTDDWKMSVATLTFPEDLL